jgi:ribosomal protein S18 acetylase RimI-like enzyme
MIRPYRPDDLATIMDIGDRAWAPIYAHLRALLGAEVFDASRPDVSGAKGRQIRAACELHPDRMLICERAGRTVGFCTLLLDAVGNGEIGNNAVDPACGEKGVGQEMYRAAFAWFRERGCLVAKVTTGLDQAHAPARRAYERAGFSRSWSTITYYRHLGG